MRPKLLSFALTVCFCVFSFSWSVSAGLQEAPQTLVGRAQTVIHGENQEFVIDLIADYCLDCHGPNDAEASFSIHELRGDIAGGKETVQWQKILEMLSLDQMPPADAERASPSDRERAISWITEELTKVGLAPDPSRLNKPKFGNRVDHEALFSGEFQGPAYSHSRLWRISPSIYAQMATDSGIRRNPNQGLADALSDSLATAGDEGFRDYSFLKADEATLRTLVTSSRTLAVQMTVPKVTVDRRTGESRVDRNRRLFRGLEMLDADSATAEELDEALNRAFEQLLQRSPTEEEQESYGDFLRESVSTGGPMLGFQNLLMAMLMSPEFLFRMELGLGESLPDGRRMLAPQEIAYALAYALTDRPPDEELQVALEAGRLVTRADVEREVRRMLQKYDDVQSYFTVPMERDGTKSKPYNVRILRFFREFFDYPKAEFVFKDMEHSRGRSHNPKLLVDDADRFVLEILDRDQDVFRQLLTSTEYFAAYSPPQHVERELSRLLSRAKGDQRQVIEQKISAGRLPVPSRFRGYLQAYNIDGNDWAWAAEQPFKIEHRAGLLTHPAWLVAHSGNFDNDPIRRGKWIREHLLADSIPDLPIGVDARLPEDPLLTLRERLDVTTAGECWRCHRQMNPLGLAFEEYDDFGSYRERITLVEEQRDRRTREVLVEAVVRSIDASGELSGSRDSELDGPVNGAIDLVHRLADSDRVRQSIIRHVFRFWMGRNEQLTDSPTLMAMDKAYVESGGSFNEVLVSLLTSDSFLYRRDRESFP